MKKFTTFLREQQNVHMEHIEDLVFNEGVDGTRRAINFLRDLRDMLGGNTNSNISATVKWDGSPAIFAGVDPRDGKFFVAKKGIFNKDPKVYKTPADIKADTTGDLAEKLTIAFTELKKIGIRSGVYQGDMLFTQRDIKTEEIDGQRYVTFHPNTIVYAVPVNSILGKKILRAKLGVVWHTTYEGATFESMTAVFGKDIIKQFKPTPSVWMDDATYKDVSGTATFTASDTKKLTKILSNAGKLFNKIDASTLNAIHDDPDLLLLIKTFNNTKVRAGQRITDEVAHVKGLYNWIYDRFQSEIDKRKTDSGKASQQAKRQKILAFFANHPQSQIVDIFKLSNLIADAKLMIIKKMNQAGHIRTFVKTQNGFRVSNVEGFCCIDHLRGGAVKIVDRMEFSRNNFSPDIVKGWDK